MSSDAATRSSWCDGDLATWFATLVFEPSSTTSVTRVARTYGIPSTDEDELQQRWYESLLVTLRRKEADGTADDQWAGEDEARAYAFRALKNRAIDMVRRRKRLGVLPSFEDAVNDPLEQIADDDPSAVTAAVGFDLRGPSDRAVDQGWYRWATRRVTQLLGDLTLPRSKCRPELVAGVVLDLLVKSHSAGNAPYPSWGMDALSGGTSAADRDLYEAMDRVMPGSVSFEAGRVTAASRQRKNRCAACVSATITLLTEADPGAIGGSDD